MLGAATEPMLRACTALRRELVGLIRHVRQLAQEDLDCRRLMSMPGIGAVEALTYRSAVDDPNRFASSKKVGHGSASPRRETSLASATSRAASPWRATLTCAASAKRRLHRGQSIWLKVWLSAGCLRLRCNAPSSVSADSAKVGRKVGGASQLSLWQRRLSTR